MKTLNFINTFWKSQLHNFVWTLNKFFLFHYLLYLSRLSFFLFCFWLVYYPIVLFWLVYSVSVWFLLYFVQYYTLKKMTVSGKTPQIGFPRIGPFFRVYSLSIRLSLQRTRHTNQTSAHIHLEKILSLRFIFMISYVLSTLLPSRDVTWVLFQYDLYTILK